MPAMIGPFPQQLGAFTGINAAMAAPTLDTDGVSTNSARFVNVWVGMSGGTSVVFQVWIYRTVQGWSFYNDVPATTILTSQGGGLFQLELRGVERVYAQLTTFTGPPTCSIYYDGVTY